MHINFRVNLFADDTILILKDKNIFHLKILVNHELKIVDEWMKSNRLFLNYSETSYFVNYPKRKKSNFLNFAVDVGGHKIPRKDSTKYLRIIIDRDGHSAI